MKNFNKIFILLCITLLSDYSKADEVFKNFNVNRFDSDFQANLFKTDSNFGSDGSKVSLPSGYTYQIIDMKIDARYVLLQDLGFYGGLNVGSSESNDSLATRKNSSLNYVHVGADYLLWAPSWMLLYVDAQYNHAIEKVAVNTDTALNGDGASEIKAQVTSIFNFDSFFPFAQAGINYRLEGLSTLLTYVGGVEIRLSDFVFGGSLNGYMSITNDSNTNTSIVRDAVTNRVDATSKKFYSINPNGLDSDIYFKYVFNKDLDFKINGGYTLLGSNSAVGYHVGTAVAWGFGGDSKSYSQPVHKEVYKETYREPRKEVVLPVKNNNRPVVQPKQNNKTFEEDTNDGVNQDYFKPVAPSKEQYIEQVDSSENKNQNAVDPEKIDNFKTKPIQDGSSVNEPKAAIQNMNDADYKIKLKRRKKKAPVQQQNQ